MMKTILRRTLGPLYLVLATVLVPAPARAADSLCDPSFEDCRTRLLELIRNEQSGIDVAFWFMEDNRYTTELIKRWQAGVSVRVLVDPRANVSTPLNADRLKELQDAGIPMRYKSSNGILHWKMMLFDGQNTVEFSAANYSAWSLTPVEPYQNYIDEAAYFADDPAIVNSFRTKFDDLWIDTSRYSDYANITAPLARRYGLFSKDPELNFPPFESYRNRAVKAYDAETVGIDVTMYRVTDRAHSDAMIRAAGRGVPVRLYTEPKQYRDPKRYWHSWNIDRMYMAGVEIRHRAHAGLNHQKSVILKAQRLIIWGSSNWTSPSTNSQEEHNHFTKKDWVYQWFVDQFERKWNNLLGFIETEPFAPLPPGKPDYIGPSNLATGVPTSYVKLSWLGGLWAHKYDIYFGTTSDPPLVQADAMLGPSTSSKDVKTYALPELQQGTTYYWRIVSKTMADQTAWGAVHSFTTEGTAPPPDTTGTAGEGDIVLYAGTAPVRAGTAAIVNDASAAGGVRLAFPNHGAAKIVEPLDTPANYFEMTFEAQGGVDYRIWMRMRAESDYWANDSVHAQFSGSIDASGAPVWRIGTTSGTSVNLENCNGCGLSGWGWQDNGWGLNVLGPLVRFENTGTQTIRVQIREDGVSIDQIVLSPATYLSTAPGGLKDDATILPATGGTTDSGTSDDSGSTGGDDGTSDTTVTGGGDEVVLWAGRATTYAGGWAPYADASAAGGVVMLHPDAGGAKISAPLATPAHYFELTFNAVAGKPYRLWLRGYAQSNYWGNDSVHVQFSGSVDASGTPIWRIGTTSGAWVNLEDGSGAGLLAWGWQDNGYGDLGPVVYFETTGPHTIRIQTREDGFAIDHVVLSSGTYLTASPGLLKNDTTILPEL